MPVISVYPMSYGELIKNVNIDSLLLFGLDQKHGSNWFTRKLLYENLIIADTSEFVFRIDPLCDLMYAKDFDKNIRYLNNTRGFRVFGSLSQNIFFESTFYENQASFPDYISDYANSSGVVPGQGPARKYSGSKFDYAQSSGSISYVPCNNFEIALGHGKHFIGNGYRSLFLSDNALNYPFLKASYRYKFIEFTRIMNIYMNDTKPKGYFDVREKRLGGYNILNINVLKNLSLSLIEATIWQYPNGRKNIDLDYNYLNPVIFVSSANSKAKCNAISGAGLTADLFKTTRLYSQIAFDKFSADNYAAQIGIKYYNALTINNLLFHIEHNQATSTIYDFSNTQLVYSHYNQPLAHPFGTNFKENIFLSQYHYSRIFFDIKLNLFQYGSDTAMIPVKKAKEIKLLKYTTPLIGKGPITEGYNINASLGFMINPLSNRRIELGFCRRQVKVQGIKTNDQFFYFSLKTSISNIYYDF